MENLKELHFILLIIIMFMHQSSVVKSSFLRILNIDQIQSMFKIRFLWAKNTDSRKPLQKYWNT